MMVLSGVVCFLWGEDGGCQIDIVDVSPGQDAHGPGSMVGKGASEGDMGAHTTLYRGVRSSAALLYSLFSQRKAHSMENERLFE